jgi:hypothetical protein
MAIVSSHFRLLWGLVDLSVANGQTPTYVNPTDYAILGPSAAAGAGIGARRATLVLDRTLAVPADDAMNMHFDFVNYTAGAPDDTWIASDYTSLEARIVTWWTALVARTPTFVRLSRIAWHRVGPGIPHPNPAERILDLASPIVGTATANVPPQSACALTFRTAVRHSWGRTYYPLASATTGARLPTATADDLANTTRTLLAGAKSDDFLPVVISRRLNSALGIETVETDDVVDIIRRRRWKHTTYRKLVTV